MYLHTYMHIHTHIHLYKSNTYTYTHTYTPYMLCSNYYMHMLAFPINGFLQSLLALITYLSAILSVTGREHLKEDENLNINNNER